MQIINDRLTSEQIKKLSILKKLHGKTGLSKEQCSEALIMHHLNYRNAFFYLLEIKRNK
jgi:hypothetical protein